MLTYPQIDPVAIHIGSLPIHWYGLMYLLSFGLAYWLMLYRAERSNGVWNKDQVSDLIFYGAMGVVLGGRCGYVLFYNFDKFVEDPLWLFQVWTGGMSFHGGLLGVLVACYLFGRKYKKSFFQITDFGAPMVPVGLFFGRIGNFIGGELWGRTTDVPWGMVFPRAGDLPRHPSQLYEMFLEGVVLFTILWWFSSRPRPQMAVSALFLIFYGSFRFAVEFVREPDSQIGFALLGWMTRGQELSLPMIIGGICLLVLALQKNKKEV
ncbi:MAG: prolipoprotein diacylglyceryl transferase [Oceanospirillaceae bacterium]|nr:prolipoprotein diacylglyceryl transferase [Oceanospirillaceae bacterium]MCP5350449.1 prolipoprotein diacylglyceryl transferase [Oceanospirillaceae bacterium]